MSDFTFTFMHWRRKWQPTPVFLPGESQGQGSLWASIYGVAQSRTRLKWLSSSSSIIMKCNMYPTYTKIFVHFQPCFAFLFNNKCISSKNVRKNNEDMRSYFVWKYFYLSETLCFDFKLEIIENYNFLLWKPWYIY